MKDVIRISIFYLCLNVVAMGDRNGVDIAQSAHEAALFHFGNMKPNEVVRYRSATPKSDLWEATYVDDHHISQRLPRNRLRCAPDRDHHCACCDKYGCHFQDYPIGLTRYYVISPHYRSEGRRQGSCGVFWGSSSLSTF